MKTFAFTAVITICGLAVGCMPANFRDAVPWMVERDRAIDAKTQPIDGMPFLRVDDFLLDRMKAAAKQTDDDSHLRIPELIEQCHLLAIDSARIEIDHLSPSAMEDLRRAFLSDKSPLTDLRETIRNRYIGLLEEEYRLYVQQLAKMPTAADQRKQAQLICERIRPSIKDHRGGGLLMELVRSTHPVNSPSPNSRTASLHLYTFGQMVVDEVKSGFDQEDTRAILKQFAPIIAQDQQEYTKYNTTCDMIGGVRLRGRPNQIEVAVQTDGPSVYAYTRKAIIRGREHIQLVYCYWYPEHPPTKPGDPEAGPIDGATVRITLDSKKRPAIVEAVQNCGCHYRCFAAKHLDVAARKEFGEPGDSQTSAMARPGTAIDLIMNDLFDVPDDVSKRPIVFSPAALHVPVGVAFDESDLEKRRIVNRSSYELHAYELLENMPTEFGRASMFGADGLVHNAGRSEGWLLAGTGMLSAGQPRQRGTQLICWDKHAFDDPHLLENMLRLPSDF